MTKLSLRLKVVPSFMQMNDFILQCLATVNSLRLATYRDTLHANVEIETIIRFPIPTPIGHLICPLQPELEEFLARATLPEVTSARIIGNSPASLELRFDPRLKCMLCHNFGVSNPQNLICNRCEGHLNFNQ